MATRADNAQVTSIIAAVAEVPPPYPCVCGLL
jgi:hypothetical protein